jgi:hypothetical protein
MCAPRARVSVWYKCSRLCVEVEVSFNACRGISGCNPISDVLSSSSSSPFPPPSSPVLLPFVANPAPSWLLRTAQGDVHVDGHGASKDGYFGMYKISHLIQVRACTREREGERVEASYFPTMD